MKKSELRNIIREEIKKSFLKEAEFKNISKDENRIKLAIKDVEKKFRLKANRDNPPQYAQLSLNKIMLSKVLGREDLGKEHQGAWEKLKKEYNLTESYSFEDLEGNYRMYLTIKLSNGELEDKVWDLQYDISKEDAIKRAEDRSKDYQRVELTHYDPNLDKNTSIARWEKDHLGVPHRLSEGRDSVNESFSIDPDKQSEFIKKAWYDGLHAGRTTTGTNSEEKWKQFAKDHYLEE